MLRKNRQMWILLVAVIAVALAGCNNPVGSDGGGGAGTDDDPSNGTLSVSISDAETVNTDELLVRIVEHDGDVNDQEDEISQGRSVIEEGNATVDDFEGDWEGTGGETYDLYVFLIDDEEDPPYTHEYEEYPHVYAQDGDYILETTLDDYEKI